MQASAISPSKILVFILTVVSVFALLAFMLHRTTKEAAHDAMRGRVDISTLETEASPVSDHARVENMRRARMAASQGDIDTVSEILQQGFTVDQDTGLHTTMLMLAAQHNQPKMVHFLVEHKARIEGQNTDGKSALIFAVEAGNVEEVRYLLSHDKKADVNATYTVREQYYSSPTHEVQTTLLHIAVIGGHLPLVRALVGLHADVNARDGSNWTALTYAAGAGRTEIVKFLVSHKADVNVGKDLNDTPLAFARTGHHDDIVKILEEAGARQ